MKKTAIIIIGILLGVLFFIEEKKDKNSFPENLLKTSVDKKTYQKQSSTKKNKSIETKDSEKKIVQFQSKNREKKAESVINRSDNKKIDFIKLYDNQEIDPEWSYEYTTSIKNSLYELLTEHNAWIENAECKKTICKLDISKAQDGSSINQTAAMILNKLSKSKWHEGSLRINSIDKRNDTQILTILVGRYKETLQ